MFSRPFRKHALFFGLVHEDLQKGGTQTSREGVLLQKERCTNLTMQNSKSPQIACYTAGIAVNTQAQSKRMCVGKLNQSHDSFLKRGKENNQKEKEANKGGTWASPPQPQHSALSENQGKEPALLDLLTRDSHTSSLTSHCSSMS